MGNSVEVTTQFDFKGETYRPSVVIDLDQVMQADGRLPDCYQLLAQSCGIGPYSYEYEVLESSPLSFVRPQGLAEAFLQGEQFDFQGFRQCWLREQNVAALAAIAEERLGVSSLAQEPALREALLEAYELGRQQAGAPSVLD
ncbi:MAG: hypothetical protein ACQETD_02745 [Pseudomonadota bacterium]